VGPASFLDPIIKGAAALLDRDCRKFAVNRSRSHHHIHDEDLTNITY
jgi:hypothetical protein